MNKILLLFAILLSSCGPVGPNAHIEEKRLSLEEKRLNELYESGSRFPQSDYRLVTVEHDSHKFIISTTYHGLQVLHHPSCPCLNKEKQ